MTVSEEMVKAEKKLKKSGYKIILPKSTYEYAKMKNFDKMHSESTRNKIEYGLIRDYYNQIKDSDAILVINVERKNIKGYIGGNSFLEMGFAFVLNKPIYLLNKIPEMSYRDEIEAMNPIILNGNLSKINK